MDLEKRHQVSLKEYQEMIRAKTAVLLSCAAQVGAMRAGADQEQCRLIGRFAEELGMAFQLKDDLLDAFGDPAVTGKQRGGDLRMGKRTWMLIHALEWAKQYDARLLDELKRPPAERNIEVMAAALESSGARTAAEAACQLHHRTAMQAMDALDASADAKRPLRELSERLIVREL